MGGDDLGSDDEYLFDSVNPSSAAVLSDDEASTIAKEDVVRTKKRKSNGATHDNADVVSGKKRKKGKAGSSTSKSSLIIQTGRGIALDGVDAQATFFGTCYSHAVKMNVSVSEQNDDTNDGKIKKPEDFVFQPHHFYSNDQDVDIDVNEKHHTNLSMYLKQPNIIPSMKRLKNWKHNHSPMVLIISLSARRCVELQKQLAFLKLPVAKLFAKHMNVDDQVKLLKGEKTADKGGGKGKKASRCFSIGVGTPGRLLALLRHGNDGLPNTGALRLSHTELVVIDCHEDSKGFNVCTLKDTAKELMEFMKEGVVSELDRRKDKIKMALF